MATSALPLFHSAPRRVNSTRPRVVTAPAKQPRIAPNRDAIVVEHMPLVRSIAKKLRSTLPATIDFEDLVHAGALGLLDAISKFDANKEIDFPSYARHRIRGAMVDSLREMDWVSRGLRRKDKQIKRATRDLSSELERAPTESELADRMGVGLEHCRNVISRLHGSGIISADTAGPEEARAMEFEGDSSTRPDSVFSRLQRQSLVINALNELPHRHRRVLSLYYTNEYTMKEIGGELGINESRVSQIHKVALTKMESLLESIGVHSSNDFSA